jgi:hypothetical protein
MGIRIKKSEPGVRIDPGVYRSIIKGVETGHHKDHGDFLIWKFKITDEVTKDGDELDDEVTMSGFTSMKWSNSKKNKLNKLLLAAGVDVDEVDVDEDYDIEDVVGQAVRIVVEDDEKEDATYSKISSFMPVKKKKNKDKEKEDKSEKKNKDKEKDEDDKSAKKKNKNKDKDKDDKDEDGDSSSDGDLFDFGDD